MHRIGTIPPREQSAWVKLLYPQFTCEVRGGLLICRGELKPTPMSETYKVRIEYLTKSPPKVWVESPKLRRRDDDSPIPHMYNQERPCLYLPSAGYWRSDKKIAQTIIPWLCMWLFYYEAWLATGEWQGGGAHPSQKAQETRDLLEG